MNGTLSIPKIFAFIQARLGSTRYPNKILKQIPQNGMTLLEHIHSRLNQVLEKEQIIFLIPSEDHFLKEYLQERSFLYFEGDLNNVRKRYIDAATYFQANVILRLTGDNPFVDTKAIETIVEAWKLSYYFNKKIDLMYYSPLPLGMGIESFSKEALENNSYIMEERHFEHVSLHIKENPKDFNIIKLPSPFPETIGNLRLTFDEELDYETLLEIYNESITIFNNKNFGAYEISYLVNRKPELFLKNQKVQQVKFNLPKPEFHQNKSILIIIGNPISHGSGHWERMTILSTQLVILGYTVHMHFNSEKISEGYDFYIIDSREDFQNEKFQSPMLRIDELSNDRKIFKSKQGLSDNGFLDLLPHPDSFGWEEEPEILISHIADEVLKEIQINEKKTKIQNGIFQNKTILCYAGSLDKILSSRLDAFLLNNFSDYKIIRIGGYQSDSIHIHYESRITKKLWWNFLMHADLFLSYFGQGLMEAMYLRKKLASYSMGDYHSMLSKHLKDIWSVPFLGDVSKQLEFEEFTNLYPILKNTAHKRIVQWLEAHSSI